MSRLAVSTLVLAALAVSDARACPLGGEVLLDHPTLPWQVSVHPWPMPAPSKSVAKPPAVTLLTAVGSGATVVKTLANTGMRCGSGRGEAIVRVQRGNALVTTSGFDPAVGECVRSAIEMLRFMRATDDTLVRVAIELR